jgi:hypothetical protein
MAVCAGSGSTAVSASPSLFGPVSGPDFFAAAASPISWVPSHFNFDQTQSERASSFQPLGRSLSWAKDFGAPA